MTMTFMSISMAFNIALVMSFIQLHILGYVFYDIKFDIFPGEKLDGALSFFILYLSVPIFINYIFIFRNNRYKKNISKYKYYNGNAFFIYFIASIVVFLIYSLFFTPTIG